MFIHLLNASAIENRRIALPVTIPGHRPRRQPRPGSAKGGSIFIGAGERVDAIVEMNKPGVWILGATEERIRNAGLGVIVEYENQHRQPQWIAPPPHGTTPFSAKSARLLFP